MCDTHGFSSIFCGSLCSDTSRLGRVYIRVLPPATIEYGTLRPIHHIISTTQQQPEKLDRKPRLPISSLPPQERQIIARRKIKKKRKLPFSGLKMEMPRTSYYTTVGAVTNSERGREGERHRRNSSGFHGTFVQHIRRHTASSAMRLMVQYDSSVSYPGICLRILRGRGS